MLPVSFKLEIDHSAALDLAALQAAAERSHPAGVALVAAHSDTFKRVREDDAAALWVGALPPLLDAAGWSRTLQLLQMLQKLQSEQSNPMRILRVRHHPLHDSIGDCTAAVLTDLLDLAQDLQLPKPLSLRLRQQAALLPMQESLAGVLCGGELLSLLDADPLLARAAAHVKAELSALAAVLFPDSGGHHKQQLVECFLDGAGGFETALELGIRAGTCTDSRLRGEDTKLLCNLAEREGAYVAGQVFLGINPLSDGALSTSRAPCAAAAYMGDIERLHAACAGGVWVAGCTGPGSCRCRGPGVRAAVAPHFALLCDPQ